LNELFIIKAFLFILYFRKVTKKIKITKIKPANAAKNNNIAKNN